jgi:hypothetical protein
VHGLIVLMIDLPLTNFGFQGFFLTQIDLVLAELAYQHYGKIYLQDE